MEQTDTERLAIKPESLDKPARYNLGIQFGNLVFTAGITGNDPASGDIVAGGIGPQTKQTLENIETILREAGTSLERAIRVDVYLANVDDFAGYNEVWEQYFGSGATQPVRTTVVVNGFKGDVIVEITVIAAK
ncbi:MAG: RidA family protein [Trueperaceae bacterium]